MDVIDLVPVVFNLFEDNLRTVYRCIFPFLQLSIIFLIE